MIGASIRRARVAAGVSLRSAAKEIGVSHVFLGLVERGQRPLPREHYPRIAKALPGWTPEPVRLEGPPSSANAPRNGARARFSPTEQGGIDPGVARRVPKRNGISLSERALSGPRIDPGVARASPSPSPDPDRRAGPPGAFLPEASGDAGPREIVIENLRVLRERLRTAPPSEVTKVTGQITAAAKVLARLDGSLEVTRGQIMRSVFWREMVAKMVKVLEPYPEAVRALAKAFEDL